MYLEIFTLFDCGVECDKKSKDPDKHGFILCHLLLFESKEGKTTLLNHLRDRYSCFETA